MISIRLFLIKINQGNLYEVILHYLMNITLIQNISLDCTIESFSIVLVNQDMLFLVVNLFIIHYSS